MEMDSHEPSTYSVPTPRNFDLGIDMVERGGDITNIHTDAHLAQGPSFAQEWRGLPAAAQRLVLCEQARMMGMGGYHKAPRNESTEEEQWIVTGEGRTIRLVGKIGERAKQDASIRANRLRGEVAQTHRRISQVAAQNRAGERLIDGDDRDRVLAQDPNRPDMLLIAQREEEGLRETRGRQEALLASAEAEAAVDTEVTFEFPVRLWEDEAWF